MLKRLWCILVTGHRWVDLSRKFNEPNISAFCATFNETLEQRAAYGYTEIWRQCSRCGASRIVRLMGDHTGSTGNQSEIEQLRKMAGL